MCVSQLGLPLYIENPDVSYVSAYVLLGLSFLLTSYHPTEKCKNPLADQNITAIARLSGMGPNLNYAICGYSEDFVIDYDST